MARNPARVTSAAEPSESSEQSAQKRSDKFVLPQQPSSVDQWADVFHLQAGPLGVRLWFGTTRGDSSGQTDIRAAVFLPGEIGRLFLAHARTMAEAQKIGLNAKKELPHTFN